MRSPPLPACISTLLLHMMCGCRESQQEQIAEKLEPVGGVVVGDKNLSNEGVIRVVLRGSKVTDVELQHLVGLEDLRHLYLDDSQVTDAGMKDISQLPAVQLLSIRNTHISDASVESISNMRSLLWLYVNDTKLSKRGIPHTSKSITQHKDRRLTSVSAFTLDHRKPFTVETRFRLLSRVWLSVDI